MAFIVAFLAPTAVACVIVGLISFAKHCKESRGLQAVLNRR